MIHSMAGGELKFNQHFDFAKVEIIEGEDIGLIFWFISPFSNLQIENKV